MIRPIGVRRTGPARLVLAAILIVAGSRAGAAPDDPAALTITAHTTTAEPGSPGSIVRLEVSCRCVAAKPVGVVQVFGRDVPLIASAGAGSWSALIGVDVETAAGTYPVRVAIDSTTGPRAGVSTLTVRRKQFPTRRLRVAPVYVDPPRAEQERIAADAARLNAIYAAVSWREQIGPFEAPVPVAPQNTFGARSLFNGQPRSLHAGVDFSAPAGAPIAAPAAGEVVLADDLFFTGKTIVLDHGRGLYSVLAHLSTLAVSARDVVERGQIVGQVGATGRATGPHLHWSARLNGARVDPMALVDLLGTAAANTAGAR